MTSLFPAGRTAFMVIHGIGEQRPFETLDSYTRGVIAQLQRDGASFSIEHRIAVRDPGGSEWTESFVRLVDSDNANNQIDIHECYWAYLTEEKASLGDIWNWLLVTACATKRYYRDNEELQQQYENQRKKQGRFLTFPIYYLLLLIFILYPVQLLWSMFIPNAFRTLFKKTAAPFATKVIAGYVGDVAIYTTTDEKSKFFPIRSKILSVSQALLESLLRDQQYDRVVVAGHSLGSVIAYDTLNRLNIKANLDPSLEKKLSKVAGLVTFGSPLDKIAFFFREHTKKEETVRRGILDALHSFRAKPLNLSAPTFPMTTQVRPTMDNFPWLNFYDAEDPVSGHLDFYRTVENHLLQIGAPWGIAHTAYWEHEKFYAETFATLFGEEIASAKKSPSP